MSKKLVDDWFGAFRDRDIAKLERTLSDDFIHTSPFGEVKGGEVYLNLVRENSEAFFSPEIELLDVIEGGDKFAARYLVNGNPACDCIYVAGGAITKIHSYYHVGHKPTLYDTWQDQPANSPICINVEPTQPPEPLLPCGDRPNLKN